MKNYMKKTDKAGPKKMQAPEHDSKAIPGSPAEEAGESASFEKMERAMPAGKLPMGKKGKC